MSPIISSLVLSLYASQDQVSVHNVCIEAVTGYSHAGKRKACLLLCCLLWWEKNGSEALVLGVLEGFLGVTTLGLGYLKDSPGRRIFSTVWLDL